jgi:hypothetical protein
MTTLSNAPAPTSATDLDTQIDALEDAFQLPSAFVPVPRTRASSRSVDAVDVVAPWTLGSRLVVGTFVVRAAAIGLMVLLESRGRGG